MLHLHYTEYIKLHYTTLHTHLHTCTYVNIYIYIYIHIKKSSLWGSLGRGAAIRGATRRPCLQSTVKKPTTTLLAIAPEAGIQPQLPFPASDIRQAGWYLRQCRLQNPLQIHVVTALCCATSKPRTITGGPPGRKWCSTQLGAALR